MKQINRKKIYILFNIVIVIFLITVFLFPKKISDTTSIEIKDLDTVNPFSDHTKITQEFLVDKNHKQFAIQFATYQHIYENGKINLMITNNKTKKTVKKVLKATTLTDTSPTTINYKLKKNTSYTLQIETSGIPMEHMLTLYTTSFDDEHHMLTINGREESRNLVLYYIDDKITYFNIWYVFLLLSISTILYPICMVGGKQDEK